MMSWFKEKSSRSNRKAFGVVQACVRPPTRPVELVPQAVDECRQLGTRKLGAACEGRRVESREGGGINPIPRQPPRAGAVAPSTRSTAYLRSSISELVDIDAVNA